MSSAISDSETITGKRLMRLRVNGEPHEVAGHVTHSLLEVLREEMGLTGTKHGCELGECGTCTVLVDGEPIYSCLMLAVEAEDREVTTVEGLALQGRAHPLQRAFSDLSAAQCGYCIPGILLAAKALLDKQPDPARADIEEALSGNLCRCTGYTKIIESVEQAVREMRGQEGTRA
ncbi:MAG: (2Fe-2S)-binding protein [Deltaproteobacteria bacterium]|nr:(2Fe-2S)-binding protein [Deltaproteobacteria bacterium]